MFAQDHSAPVRVALAALLSASILDALPARAADSDTVASRIGIADLNLASAAGLATLRHRIAVAANQVCQQAIYDEAIGGIGYANCYSQVRERAWAQAELAIAAAQTATKTASRTP